MEYLLNKSQLAQKLGVSLSFIEKLVIRKAIPFIKLGPHKNAGVRFDEREISIWLRSFNEHTG